jgi:hypothetical protein
LQGRAISANTLPDKTPCADDFKSMSARKLVYRSMVFAPAIFLIGLGVHARSLDDDFHIVANDPSHERAVLAYVPYLKKSAAFVDGSTKQSLPEARRIAKIWIEGAKSGDLKPLTPIAFEDTSSEGAKSEIFEVNGRIVTCLVTGVTGGVHKKNYHQATEDAVLAVQMAGILKHSDFISLFNSATAQRRAIQEVSGAFDKLPEKDRERLTTLLPLTQTKHDLVTRMIKRSHQLFVTWRQRRGYEPLSIEDTRLLSDIPALVEGGNAVSLQKMRHRMFASKDDYIPTYCSSLRIGVSAQDLLHKEILDLVRTINVKRASP